MIDFVVPGLVPGIHDLLSRSPKDVDGRDKPGHDERKERRTDAICDSPARRGGFATGQRMTKGLAGTSVAVEIHTLLVSRYSRTASMPLSRPTPEYFMPPNGIM
jgi:hypothetical protein